MSELDPKKFKPLPDGRVVLCAGFGRLTKGIALIIFAIFWLGITGTLTFIFVDFSEGGGWRWDYLFFVVFWLVGLGVLVGGIYSIVSSVMVSRRLTQATVTVERLPLRLGETFRLWYEQQVKQSCHIEHVTAKLICKEWVEYRVGTDTRTAEQTVYESEQRLLEATDARTMSQLTGDARFEIPAGAMHSFEAHDNKIQWHLELTTAIASWPDDKVEFPLLVSPRLAPQAAANGAAPPAMRPESDT